MKNIIYYLENNFKTFDELTFNVIDSLILSQLCYIELGSLLNTLKYELDKITIKDLLKAEFFDDMFNEIPAPQSNKELLFALCANPRFRNIEVRYHLSKIEKDYEKQFCATTFLLSDQVAYIGFRGTDFTLTGWKEDFNMAFANPIPSQVESVDYINTVAANLSHDLYIGGHSKGGNLSVYGASYCDLSVHKRILTVYSHDGPGFSQAMITSPEFNLIKDKIHKTIPQSSIVGMLLENHEDYYVIKSQGNNGITQHSIFAWEIIESDLIYLDSVSKTASFTNKTLNNLLTSISEEKRKLIIDALFDVLSSTNFDTFLEVKSNWKSSIPTILNSAKHLNPESKEVILDIIKELAALSLNTKK